MVKGNWKGTASDVLKQSHMRPDADSCMTARSERVHAFIWGSVATQ